MKKRSICIFLAGMISLYSEAGISAPVWAEPGITAEAAGTEDADVLDETTITSDVIRLKMLWIRRQRLLSGL